MPDYVSPTVRRRRLARELRRLREQAGLTGDEVAETLGWSTAKVSRYELARTGLKPNDVANMLDLYGVETERRTTLLILATEARRSAWWERYAAILPQTTSAQIGLEAEAVSIREWNLESIPILFQTKAYGSEVIRASLGDRYPPSVIQNRIEAHLRRQEILAREPPLLVESIIDESTLLRNVADADVMYEQLRHLASISERSNIILRVLPLGVRQAFIRGSFTYLQLSRDAADIPDVVCRDTLSDSVLFIETAEETHQYSLAFRRLALGALSETDSLEHILSIARSRWA